LLLRSFQINFTFTLMFVFELGVTKKHDDDKEERERTIAALAGAELHLAVTLTVGG